MRVARVFAAFAPLLLILASCAAPQVGVSASASATPAPSQYPLAIADDQGHNLTFPVAPSRVVSLAASATEIVFALGAGDRLVAVDDFSDFPSAAASVPHIGGFRTSPETVVSYRPDLILAVTSGTLASQLLGLHQPVFVLDPSDLEGVYQNINSLGKILGRETSAQQVVSDMRTRISAVADRAKTASTRPRVLHEVDSTNPAQIFVAGPHNFVDSMITLAGGVNVAADASVKFPKLSPEEIVRRDPEVIVLADARFGATPDVVAARPGWAVISAVRLRALYPIDDNIVSRPGPRLVDGFEAYVRLIHPELFR